MTANANKPTIIQILEAAYKFFWLTRRQLFRLNLQNFPTDVFILPFILVSEIAIKSTKILNFFFQ